MPRPSAEQSKAQLEKATEKLNLHHVAVLTGIPYSQVKDLLDSQALTHASFFEQVNALFTSLKKFNDAKEMEGLSDEELENNLEYQTVRLRKVSADLKQVELNARKENLAPREDLERVLSHASVLIAKTLDGLIPEVEMLVPDASQEAIDAIGARLAEARNTIANTKLPD